MPEVDPITFEVVRNALLTAAAEMKVVVMRSSYSTIWRESGDLSCAILSCDGEMIAHAWTSGRPSSRSWRTRLTASGGSTPWPRSVSTRSPGMGRAEQGGR